MDTLNLTDAEPTFPRALGTRAAPLPRARETSVALMGALLGAGLLLAAVGTIYYGPRALLLSGSGVVSAALAEAICAWAMRRPSQASLVHSIAVGLLVVLMLPATVPWYVAAAGAGLAVGGGKWLMGGLGHYPWNPAAVAILGLFLLWPQSIAPDRWPLLSRENAVAGSGLTLGPLVEAPTPVAWEQVQPAPPAVGIDARRADAILHDVLAGEPGAPSVETAVRDLLPSWWDMLAGAVPGAIGQGSILALMLAGLVLVWRGYLRWTLPLAVLGGALFAAAVLPVAVADGAARGWLPIRYVVDGQPVGLIWTAYQVLLGPTLFVAVMLAGETVTRPLTGRGQVVYGLGVGVLTVVLRAWPMALLSGCWAVLAMNTLVPLIERLARRCRTGWYR